MKLTVQIERLLDGRFKGYFAEMPEVFYFGETEAQLQERLGRLTHALDSPNIRIDRVTKSGDVILIIERGSEEDQGDSQPVFSFLNQTERAMA